MKLRCVPCNRSWNAKDILLEDNEILAVYACPTCNARYVSVNLKEFQLPQLFKLTRTKSFLMNDKGDNGDNKG